MEVVKYVILSNLLGLGAVAGAVAGIVGGSLVICALCTAGLWWAGG